MIGFFFALTLVAQLPQTADTTGAYRDERTRELHERAIARRRAIDRSITSYQAVSKERISVGLRRRLRDQLLYRRETASRIDWRRGGPINITALAAREGVPFINAAPNVPKDLDEFLPHLAFDPMDTDALLNIDTTALKHPISETAAAYYRFSLGDSTTIDLGQRTVTMVELKVEPRYNDFRLVSGSFWIDRDTYSLVQTTFRLARGIDFEENVRRSSIVSERRIGPIVIGSDSGGSKNLWFTPMRAEIEYITIEYNLVHLRWWLPRLLAAEGLVQMGPLKSPMHYERSYEQYEVTGDTTVTAVPRDSLSASERRICRPRFGINVSVGVEDNSYSEYERRVARDSAAARERRDRLARDTAYARRVRQREEMFARDTAAQRRIRERRECNRQFRVSVEDSSALLTSSLLSSSIYDDQELTTDPELTRLMNRLKKLADPPWQARAATFAWGLGGSGLVRYNKIEALSVGARTESDFGRMRLDATGRIGAADLEPNFELGLSAASLGTQFRFAGYRRLEVMDKASGLGGFTGSLSALFVGRDERDYYRTFGGELIVRPLETSAQWFTLRLFGETQRPLRNETRFSLPRVWGRTDGFDANLLASRADQIGMGLTLTSAWGQNPASFRLITEATVEGSVGTFDYVRESLLLRLGIPLPIKLAGAVEVAAGTTQFHASSNLPFNGQPPQSQWFLGGVRSIRGYEIGHEFGPAFWRARGEIGTALPAARLVLFSDFGWTGNPNRLSDRASMWSVGAGGSFLDGILRIDLARALRNSNSWRLHVSVDGIL